ncbi:MAG: glycosyltransferase family 4 protein [Synechococcales cyanobacterium K44_A2020_017]|nr:glycosyltransferase family 4 protein [Synechococcales cyanobacterium K32_A2020_035]MBF2093778.1 glycosyltransferase family 4 protein [Synechococcales cyanobacterium K44_A2020_017]
MSNLAGVNVLVDGYNLQLSQGTGIKTYGISLVRSLKDLGAEVNVLYGRNIPKLKDASLEEVLFFDVHEGPHRYLDGSYLKRSARLMLDVGRTLSHQSFTARPIDVGHVVIRGSVRGSFMASITNLLDITGTYNLPGCYRTASALFRLGLAMGVTLPKKVDIFHATYTLPMTVPGAKKITTIHDLIPLRLPYTTLDNKRLFYKIVKRCLKDSALVVTVSEHSKRDMVDLFDIHPDKIQVTYQPIALEPLDKTPEEIQRYIKRFRIEHKNYILFVGAIEPKKNLGRLIDAYARLETDTQFVIVGKRGWLWENEIGAIDTIFGVDAAKAKFRILDYVTTEDLRHLYAGATCLAFPSLYEGFGLPPLEAMSFGCPVITSNVSSLPEVCGEAALYVDPYSVSDIEQKLSQLLGDEALQKDLAKAGRKNAERFSLERYNERLQQAYQLVL